MKKINTLICVTCLLLCLSPMSLAKTGKIKYNSCVKYRGELEQKSPQGQGELSVTSLYLFERDLLLKRAVDIISGSFSENRVSNATLKFCWGDVFEGDLEYSISNETIEYCLVSGKISSFDGKGDTSAVAKIATPIRILRYPFDSCFKIVFDNFAIYESTPIDVSSAKLIDNYLEKFVTNTPDFAIKIAGANKLFIKQKSTLEIDKNNPFIANHVLLDETYQYNHSLRFDNDAFGETNGTRLKITLPNNDNFIFDADLYHGQHSFKRTKADGVITFSDEEKYQANLISLVYDVFHKYEDYSGMDFSKTFRENRPFSHTVTINYSNGDSYFGSLRSLKNNTKSNYTNYTNTILNLWNSETCPKSSDFEYGKYTSAAGFTEYYCAQGTLSEIEQKAREGELAKAHAKVIEEQRIKEQKEKEQKDYEALCAKWGKKYIDVWLTEQKIVPGMTEDFLKEFVNPSCLFLDREYSDGRKWYDIRLLTGDLKMRVLVVNGKVELVDYYNR